MRPNSFWKNSFQEKSQSYLKNMAEFKGFLDFSNGENALLMPKKMNADIHSVSDSSGIQVKEAIAKMFNVSFDMITIGNGSDEIIENIPRVFLEPNEATLVILPTFFRFIESSLRMKGKIIKVSALAKDGFKFNEKLMKKVLILIKRFQPKIIWLCSPNNPTGETMTLEQIEIITKKSENLVAVDEAFQEFVDPENKKSAINLIKKHNNLLVLKTFSKSWRLSGIRFGFAIGSPKIIGILEKWRLPFTVSDISKQIVLNFIDRQDNIKPLITVIINNRRNLFNEIKKLKNFEIGADSKTNVFILRHKNKDIFKELLKHNILTADLRNLDGLKGKNFVRVTIKSKKENNILLKVLSIINL